LSVILNDLILLYYIIRILCPLTLSEEATCVTSTLGDTVHTFRFQNPCSIDKHIFICPLTLSEEATCVTSTLGDTVHTFRFQNPCSIDKHNILLCPLPLSETAIFHNVNPRRHNACIPFPESMFYRQTYLNMSIALIGVSCFHNITLGDTMHVFRFQNPCSIDKHNILNLYIMSTDLIGNRYFHNVNPGRHSACIPFPESMFYRQTHFNMSTDLIGNRYFHNVNPGRHSAYIPFPESMFYRQT
jgi:hypothetical protein